MGQPRRTWIDVPLGREDEARTAGATFSRVDKFWYWPGSTPPDQMNGWATTLEELRRARHQRCLAWWDAPDCQ